MIVRLFNFIDFLESSKSQVAEYRELFSKLLELQEEQNKLSPTNGSNTEKRSWKTKQEEKDRLLFDVKPLYNDFLAAFESLDAVKFDAEVIKNVLVENIELENETLTYIQKYINFRKETKTFTKFYFSMNFNELDKELKEIYIASNGKDDGLFDDFLPPQTVSIASVSEQTHSQANITPQQSESVKTRAINEREIRKLFTAKLNKKAEGQTLALGDKLINSLKSDRTKTKEYARIARIMFESKSISHEYTGNFRGWLCAFYSLIGIENGHDYRMAELKETKKHLIDEFHYLM